jgi:hypothetical protein
VRWLLAAALVLITAGMLFSLIFNAATAGRARGPADPSGAAPPDRSHLLRHWCRTHRLRSLHFSAFLVLGGSWDGPVSWRKPTTFGLSCGLSIVAITWVTSYLTFGSEGNCLVTAQTPPNDHRLLDPARPPRRGRAAWTAIGRAHGRHRTFLIATCIALVLAAIGDEATGYDGPGPFIDLAFAVMVALIRWRFIPPLTVAMCAFFLFGGLANASASRLIHPNRALDFAAGWLQMLSFVAAAIFAVTSAVYARRTSR